MTSPFRIWATNWGQAEFEIRNDTGNGGWLDGGPNRPRIVDRLDPRTFDLTVTRNIPIRQFANVRISKLGKPYMRGYVAEVPRIEKQEKKLKIYGYENLLLTCPGGPCFYPKTTTSFATLFSDTLTEQDPREPPGLLAVANSFCPPGIPYTVHHAGDNIIKMAGAGPASRLGNCAIYSCGYDGVRQLSEQFALANLTAVDDSYYRDTTNNDLYVRIDAANDRAWPDLGGLLFDNAFDTTIRLGELQDVSQTLRGNLQLTLESNIGDIIVGVAQKHGLFATFQESRTYTYLDILEAEA